MTAHRRIPLIPTITGLIAFPGGGGLNAPPLTGTAILHADFPADETGPVIISPADNATGISLTAPIVLTFDEDLAFGTSGTITLRRNNAGTWVDDDTFDVATDQGAGPGQVSIGGTGNKVLTIRPTADLGNVTEYALRFAAGAIKDGRGNPMAAIADDTTLSFTTTDGVFTTVAGQLTYFKDPSNWPTTGGKATFAVKGLLTNTGGTQYLFEMTNGNIGLDCTSARQLRLTLRDSAATVLLNSVTLGTIPAFGTEFEFIVSVDLAALTVWTTLNGVTTTTAIPANSGIFAGAARKLSFLSRATPGNYGLGTFRKLEAWSDGVTGGGRPPTDAALRTGGRITGPAAVANASTWKQGGDTT